MKFEDCLTKRSAFKPPVVVQTVTGFQESGIVLGDEFIGLRFGADRERVADRTLGREDKKGWGLDTPSAINTRNTARELVNVRRARGTRSRCRQVFLNG